MASTAAAAQTSKEVVSGGAGGTYSRVIGGEQPAVHISTANESLSVEPCSGVIGKAAAAAAAAAAAVVVQPLGNSTARVSWRNGFSETVAAAETEVEEKEEKERVVVRCRSVVDVIAEAMRDNSVEHRQRSGGGSGSPAANGNQQTEQQQPGNPF